MNGFVEGDEAPNIYNVVVNSEEQYSLWPFEKEPPNGWRKVGVSGNKAECGEYVKKVWTDMRPLSLRKKMEEQEKARQKEEQNSAIDVCK
ncbi:MbtH family NRPS accessory protein [Candidatus Parabeggiatoa sp. HSG14]|uniref:MbtH family protein n=1 Tax=Candidatus Parabeggiatoa sp. HSG14 TaxID=3055593 RepID=UPI0025A8C643|nr:MbtH family NRPS accessory protein [Thiotrichales bacterium HSG14]